MTIQTHIIDDIKAERKRQDEKWGGSARDAKHTMSEWRDLILGHTYEASDAAAAFDMKTARRHLVEVAALAVAALEAMDRMALPVYVKKRYQCPECGSYEIRTERRLNGNSTCTKCAHFDLTANFPLVEVVEEAPANP